MEFSSREIAVMLNALEARKEWAEDDGEILDEQPHIISAINKLENISTKIVQNKNPKEGFLAKKGGTEINSVPIKEASE